MRALLALPVALAAFALSPSASAAGYAYQWVNCSSSGCTAPTNYALNSLAGSHSVTRSSAGVYTVSLGAVGGAGGNVQVVAYGASSTACNVGSWTTSGTSESVTVRCNTLAGAATDSSFVVFYQNHPTWANLYAESAYVWTSSSSGTVGSSYSYNSTGGSNTVSKTSTGNYTVTLNGMTDANANVMLTPYGTTTNRCRISSWGASATATTVYVQCNNAAGTAADTQFSLSVATGDVPFNINDSYGGNYGAWAYVNSAAVISSSFCLHSFYRTCNLTATKTATGTYKVTIPYLSNLYAVPVVSTYGSSARSCRVRSWTASPTITGTDVYVECASGTGTLADTAFTLTYLSSYEPVFIP